MVHYDETDDPHSRFLELLNALVLMKDYGIKLQLVTHVPLVHQTIHTHIECLTYSKKVV